MTNWYCLCRCTFRNNRTFQTIAEHMPWAIQRTRMTCPHDHLENCDRCELLASVLADIHDALEKMSNRNVSRDVIEELTFIKGQAKQNILAWKAHLLRCVNRDEARLEVINALDESSVLPVQDWAMKFLPKKFRESQSDWFAKEACPGTLP